MGDAGRGGIDQPRHAIGATGLDHVLRTHHIGLVIAVVTAPCAGLGGIVEHRIDTSEGVPHRLRVGQVAADLAHAQALQHRVIAALEAHHLVPTRAQAAAQRLAKKAATTGHQYLHRTTPRL